MVRRLILASLALASGCQDVTEHRAHSLVLRTASGAAVDLSSVSTARIAYDLDTLGSVEEEVSGPVVGGSYDLDVRYLGTKTEIYQRIEFDDSSGTTLLGGTPWLTDADGSSAQVIVGAPGTCEVVPALALGTAREQASAVLAGRYVLVSGGTEAGGPSAKVDRLDLMTNTIVAMPDTATPLGPSRAAMIDRTSALVLSDLRAPYVQTVTSLDAVAGRYEPGLHAGAETSVWVDNLGASGALVVGGGPAGTPSNLVSFVMPRTHAVYTVPLRTTAERRMIGTGSTGLWVASYVTPTSLTFEHMISEGGDVRRRGSTFNDAAGAGLERHGGHMVVDTAGMSMGVFGGTDQNGVVRTDTIKMTGCPVGCFTVAGPTWTNARTGVTVVNDLIVGGDGPDAEIERVLLPINRTDPLVIEPFASLTIPRSNPAVVVLPSGPVLVIGGRGASGPVADTEICFPPR